MTPELYADNGVSLRVTCVKNLLTQLYDTYVGTISHDLTNF